MKLYLSSYRIPAPDELSKLLGKPLGETSVALITNAKDYYADRARSFKVGELVKYMEQLGLSVDTVDLRNYNNPDILNDELARYDLIWAMGGNTYMLRYEMQRSGLDTILKELLETGIVYGGDSAGALVAGLSIAGVELADEPEFADEIITEGLGLVSHVILPHIDNPEFHGVLPIFKEAQRNNNIIELKDSQAVIFIDDNYKIVDANI